MLVILPVGVEKSALQRLPWISMAIAASCAVVFALTWIGTANPGGVSRERIEEALQYWYPRSDLNLPRGLEKFIDPEQRRAMDQGRVMDRDLSRHMPGAPEINRTYVRDPQQEQEILDRMVADIQAMAEKSPLVRYALVPARGHSQIGWFTHLFLHWGWVHFGVSLFFFLMVAPLLEDTWGRLLFLGFYLTGGLAAAALYAALGPQSSVPYLGATGAIGACVGAFTYRFAFQDVRVAYLVWFGALQRGSFGLPAWCWGLSWLLSEGAWFVWGGERGGAAVGAQLGGFGFGLLLALALRLTRIEARYIAPALEKQQEGWSEHPGIVAANHALAQCDRVAAEKAFRQVLASQADHLEANLGLARIELGSKRAAEGMQHLEHGLRQLLASSQNDRIFQLLLELEKPLEPARLSPTLALRLAGVLEKGPEALRPLAESLYLVSGRAGGALGAKGMLRAAELRIDKGDLSASTRRLLADLRQLPELDETLQKRLAELVLRAEKLKGEQERDPSPPEPPTVMNLGSPLPEAPPPAKRAQTVACRVISLTEDEIRLAADTGHKTSLPLKRIRAIAVGVVQQHQADSQAPARSLLVVDLLVPKGQDPEGDSLRLRMDSGTIPFALLYPQVPTLQASQRFLTLLLERSGAQALTDREAIAHGQYPRFRDIESFEAATYR